MAGMAAATTIAKVMMAAVMNEARIKNDESLVLERYRLMVHQDIFEKSVAFSTPPNTNVLISPQIR